MFSNRIHRVFPVLFFVGAALLSTIGAAEARPSDAPAEGGRAAPPASNELAKRVAALTGKAGGLTSAQVVARAVDTSNDAAAKKADVEYAARQVDRAVADFFPRVSLTAKYARLNHIDGEPLGPFVVAPGVLSGPIPAGTTLAAQPLAIESIDNQISFVGSLSVPLSDYALRLVQARSAATKSEKAAQLAEKATLRKVALDARALYYNWVKAELAVEVAEQSLVLAEEQEARIKNFVEAGSATFADEQSAVALVASSKLLLTRSKNLAQSQRSQLGVTMHIDGKKAAAFSIGEEFATQRARPAHADDLDALWREAIGSRPELASARIKVSSLGDQATVARSKAFPRLDAFASLSALNPDQRAFPAYDTFRSAWQVGATLSYSPNDTVDGVLSASAVEKQAKSAAAREAALEDAIRGEVNDSRRSYHDAEASVESTLVSLAAAEEEYRARHQLFLNDRATAVELTQAHSDLLHARLDAVSATVGLRIAAAQLDYAAGRDGR